MSDFEAEVVWASGDGRSLLVGENLAQDPGPGTVVFSVAIRGEDYVLAEFRVSAPGFVSRVERFGYLIGDCLRTEWTTAPRTLELTRTTE